MTLMIIHISNINDNTINDIIDNTMYDINNTNNH